MKVTKTTPKQTHSFTIECDSKELLALYAIFCNIGGDPKGPRSVAEAINNAIEDDCEAILPKPYKFNGSGLGWEDPSKCFIGLTDVITFKDDYPDWAKNL